MRRLAPLRAQPSVRHSGSPWARQLGLLWGQPTELQTELPLEQLLGMCCSSQGSLVRHHHPRIQVQSPKHRNLGHRWPSRRDCTSEWDVSWVLRLGRRSGLPKVTPWARSASQWATQWVTHLEPQTVSLTVQQLGSPMVQRLASQWATQWVTHLELPMEMQRELHSALQSGKP